MTADISTFSKALTLARRGKNKEHDLLDQIHLALVFGQESRLPVCFRILPGNITDVSTVRNLVRDLAAMGVGKVHLVMDRGYYSEQNINALLQQRYKFLIGGKTSLNFVKEAVDEVRHIIGDFSHYYAQLDVYAVTKPLKWQISQPHGKDPEVRRVYLHLYYSEQRSANDRRELHQKIHRLKTELETGYRNASHEAQYAHYFVMKEYPKRKISVTVRKGVLEKEARCFGYFALMTNDIPDAGEALRIYRAKEKIEKAFGNLKERLGLRRPGVSSDANLPGKIFVQYIALIICSYIQNTMRQQELYQYYSYYTLLDELDVIEYYEHPGKRGYLGEITKKQREIYQAFAVDLPK